MHQEPRQVVLQSATHRQTQVGPASPVLDSFHKANTDNTPRHFKEGQKGMEGGNKLAQLHTFCDLNKGS